MNSYHLKRVPARPDTNLGPPPQRRNPVARWVMMGLLALFSLGSVMPTASLADETIDVMVVYTNSAATSPRAKIDGIDNLIPQVIGKTNDSYTNSGVTQQLGNPYKGEVSFDESSYDWDDILGKLKGTTDGHMDDIHKLRDRHKADVVVLLVNKAKGCGFASQMDENDGAEFADSAFAVVNVNKGCLDKNGGYAFAKQLGHLMGCTNDQGHKIGFSRTIMESLAGFHINHWSNPDIKYLDNATGDADHNCAATLNNTAETVAKFRYPKPGTLQFKTVPQNVDENVGTVTIEVTRTDGKDGKVSVDLKDVTSSTTNPATLDSDYTVDPSLSTTLNWGDWDDSSRFVKVSIIDDSLTEREEEAIKFALSNVTGGATLGQQDTTQVNINYNRPGTLQFKTGQQSVSVDEDEGTVTFEVTRTDGKMGKISVDLKDVTSSTTNPATLGSDYTVAPSLSTTLNWGDWDDSSRFVKVSIIDDVLMENTESLKFALSSVTGDATLGKQKIREVIIEDDDGADAAFVIDNTGSMSEEIAGTREALTKYTQKIVDSGIKSPRINFMTFRDAPYSWGITDDLATVQNWTNRLVAIGGGDCPEGSVEALNLAVLNLKQQGRILFFTDASAHAGLNIDDTIAKLKAKSIRVDAMLTGDCVNTRRADRTDAENLFSDNHDTASTTRRSPRDGRVKSAREVFSRIAFETGGSFIFMPEVNDGTALSATKFENSIFNVMSGINEPVVTDITPKMAIQGSTLELTINASNANFNDSSSVSFGNGIVVNEVKLISATQLVANVTVPSGLTPGFYDVSVTTRLGTEIETAEGRGALQVIAPRGVPEILSVVPFTGIKGTTVTVKISGFATQFNETSQLILSHGMTVKELTVHSPTSMTATIDITPETSASLHRVLVKTGSQRAGKLNAFLVLPETVTKSAVPKITALTPSRGAIGTQWDIEIEGTATHFLTEESFLEFSGSGMSVLSFDVISATRATATIAINSDAALGYRDVFINTGDETAAMLNGFEILQQPPEITQVTPTDGARGETLEIEIIAQRSHFLAGKSVATIEGTDVTVLSTTVISPTKIIAKIQVEDSAKLGWRDVSVTTGSEIATLRDGFEAAPKKAILQEETPEELRDLYLVNGRVVDKDNNPIEGVTLQVGDETATTNALGYWEIVGLVKGEYSVVANKEGYTFAPTDFTLGDSDDFIVEVKVEPATTGFEFQQTFANHIVADGFVDRGEWRAADYEVDRGGPSNGAMYAMGRRNYPVNGYKYQGCFLFLLHNIELLTTQYEADYNVFDIYPADDPNNPTLTVWVFNDIDNPANTDADWLEPAGLSGDYPEELDDRGFLVYNHELDEYRHWLPEDTAPADGVYDWSSYWGLHALGGFNNSAFEKGLPEAIDNDNALYEVIYRAGDVEMCQDGPQLLLRRTVKYPDESGPTFPPITYWDDEIEINKPLLVTLSSFTAEAGVGTVTLNWVTDTEDDNAGFIVWRGQPLNGECTADLNNYTDVQPISSLVDSEGNEVSGAAYSYEDTEVMSGDTVCYALESRDFSDNSTYHLNAIRAATVQ